MVRCLLVHLNLNLIVSAFIVSYLFIVLLNPHRYITSHNELLQLIALEKDRDNESNKVEMNSETMNSEAMGTISISLSPLPLSSSQPCCSRCLCLHCLSLSLSSLSLVISEFVSIIDSLHPSLILLIEEVHSAMLYSNRIEMN